MRKHLTNPCMKTSDKFQVLTKEISRNLITKYKILYLNLFNSITVSSLKNVIICIQVINVAIICRKKQLVFKAICEILIVNKKCIFFKIKIVFSILLVLVEIAIKCHKTE